MSTSSGTAYDYLFKFLILGDSAVTKYIMKKGHFPSGIHYIDGKKIQIEINCIEIDKKYATIGSSHYSGVHGIIIIFNKRSNESPMLDEVTHWVERINRYASPGVSQLLVGRELKNGSTSYEIYGFERVQKFAERLKIPFVKISETDYSNMERAIDKLVDDVYWKISRMSEKSKV